MKIAIHYCPTSQNNKAKAASLAALIRKRLRIAAVLTPGEKGQFLVTANGVTIASRGGNFLTRRFGGGYPDFEALVTKLGKKQDSESVGYLIRKSERST